MIKALIGVVGATAFALVVACSGGGNSGSGSTETSCEQQIGGNSQNSACTSCVQNSCASQLNSATSACSGFFSCVCPSGTYNSSLLTGCASKETSGCQQAGEAITSCENSNCKSQCSASSSGSSGGGSGGGSGSGSGSGSGGGSPTCSSTSGSCSGGKMLNFCIVGTESSCYYTVGSQMFSCTSCTDVSSCAQAAATACQ